MPRIKRVSDGKVFSSPRGVAMHYKLPITNKIRFCADGLLPDVLGEKWVWTFEETPVVKDRKRRKKKGKNVSQADYYNYRGRFVNKNNQMMVEFLCSVIREWLRNRDNKDEPITVSNFCAEINALTKELHDESMEMKSRGFSRHFKLWEPIYREMVGMEVLEIRDRRAKRNVAALKFFDVEPKNFSKVVTEFLKQKPSVIREGRPKKSDPRARFVRCLNNNKRYASIRQASKDTGLTAYKIVHCCEGDIDYATDSDGTKYYFRYDRDL